MQAKIATLKNNLSKYVRAVRDGEEVVVMDRDRPVARIVPYRAAEDGASVPGSGPQRDHERIDVLMRRGAISHRGQTAGRPADAGTPRPTALPPGSPSLSDLFTQMRGEESW